MYLTIIVIILIITFWIFKTSIYSSVDQLFAATFYPAVNLDIYKKMLREKLIIYNQLDNIHQKSFENRIAKFLRFHNFVWVDNPAQDQKELEVLIAGTAIQITYGYPDVYLRHFKDIIIYKEEYQSSFTGQVNEGEVNTMGAILLSKKNIEIGFADPADGRNLVLHELAHALLLDNIFGTSTPDFLNSEHIYRFQQLALDEIDKMDSGNESFFREYGATNFQEFFAVAVECFYEQSGEFMNYHPELYEALRKLLNVDLKLIVRTNH